jgi:hypothetical protein
MTTKPTPSPEAVTEFAKAYHDRMCLAYPPQYHLPSWDQLTDDQRDRMRAEGLPILTAALPQIAADVLNHYADEAESPEQHGWVGRFSTATWLRSLAEGVLS